MQYQNYFSPINLDNLKEEKFSSSLWAKQTWKQGGGSSDRLTSVKINWYVKVKFSATLNALPTAETNGKNPHLFQQDCKLDKYQW